MFRFNCFCIDLSQFDSPDQILDFLKSNKIEFYINENNLWDAKIGNFTHGQGMNKIWIDSVTYCVFAYTTDTEAKFTVQFVEYFNSLEPLDYGQGVTQLVPEINVYRKSLNSLDEILDKINTYGINSLTSEELEILKSKS